MICFATFTLNPSASLGVLGQLQPAGKTKVPLLLEQVLSPALTADRAVCMLADFALFLRCAIGNDGARRAPIGT